MFSHRKYRIALVLISALLALLLQGCYTFSATSLPKHIKTVHIAEVDNRTTDPLLAVRLEEGFREMFRKNASGIRLVNEVQDADAKLEVALKYYANRVSAASRNAEVQSYEVTMRVDVLFQDLVKDKVIYEEKNVQAQGFYDLNLNESEEQHGQKRAIEQLQETVINKALSDW